MISGPNKLKQKILSWVKKPQGLAQESKTAKEAADEYPQPTLGSKQRYSGIPINPGLSTPDGHKKSMQPPSSNASRILERDSETIASTPDISEDVTSESDSSKKACSSNFLPKSSGTTSLAPPNSSISPRLHSRKPAAANASSARGKSFQGFSRGKPSGSRIEMQFVAPPDFVEGFSKTALSNSTATTCGSGSPYDNQVAYMHLPLERQWSYIGNLLKGLHE